MSPDATTFDDLSRDGLILGSSGAFLVTLKGKVLKLYAAGQERGLWIAQGRIRPLMIGATLAAAKREARAWLDQLDARGARNAEHALALGAGRRAS